MDQNTSSMKKVQQTLAASWKRRRDSDHAQTKRLLQERGVGLLGVPTELLDIIVEYSDLSTRFAAVQTSHQFYDSIDRLSPRLEYRILRNRFPLLATVMDADRSHAPAAPRELFRMYSQFFEGADDEALPEVMPTVGLDAYTLALEIVVIGTGSGTQVRPRESVFVGTGTLDTSNSNSSNAVVLFQVPRGLWTNVEQRMNWGRASDVRVKIVATRRVGARLQHAVLFDETLSEGDEETLYFDFGRLPMSSSTALRWFSGSNVADMHPGLDVWWNRNTNHQEPEGAWRHAPSTVHVQFSWSTPHDMNEQSLTDACLTFEHYVDWK